MNDIKNMLIVILLFVAFFGGYNFGKYDERYIQQQEAISVGVAEFVLLTNKNSVVEFRYITNIVNK